MNKTYEFFNEWHLGDQIFDLFYLSRLAVLHPDDFYVYYCHVSDQIRELVEDLDNIEIAPLANRTPAAIGSWIGTDRYWHTSPLRNDYPRFYLDWFNQLEARTGVRNPFSDTEQFWFDFASILKPVSPSRRFDVLLVNSRPDSGQFPYDPNQMRQLAELLAEQGLSVIATDHCGVRGVECTRDHRLSISGIANLSNRCRFHVMISTGPSWLTFNTTNRHLPIKRIVLLKTIRLGYPDVIYCDDMPAAVKALVSEGIL